MKWLKYIAVLVVGLGVVMNLEQLVEDAASEQDSPIERPQKSPQAKRRIAAITQIDEGIPDSQIRIVLQALERNSPHGRSWEHLEQDDFAVEVEKWVDETLEEAGMNESHKDAMAVGEYFYRKDDPYLRYFGFTLMYRSGPEKERQIGLLWQLAEHPDFVDYYIHDEVNASHERLVRHKLIYELAERYGQNTASSLKHNSTEEEYFEIKARFKNAYEAKSRTDTPDHGLMRVQVLFENID